MRQIVISFYLIFYLPLFIYSNTIKIEGSIVDSLTHEPVQFTTLQVIDIQNKVIFVGIADDSTANFTFSDVSVENGFKLVVTCVGYQRKEIHFNIQPHQKAINFGVISLLPANNLLSEVIIKGQRKIQEMLDRTIYKIDSAALSKAIATPEILKNIPEIMINPITLETNIKGKENTLVLINGINNGRSVDIRLINPKDIDKIEVITSPPSSYDVAYDGIINIILKQEPRKGCSGDVDATFMPNGRYVDADAGIIIGGEKTRINISYSNYLRDNSWELSETRNNLITGESYQAQGDCKNPFELTHIFKLGLDYYPKPKSFINISTENSFADVDKNISFKPVNIESGISTSLTPFSIQDISDYFIGNYTIFYKRDLKKEGNSVSTNVNLHYMDGVEHSDYTYEGAPKHTNDENGKKYSANVKVEYMNNLSDKIRMTAGIQSYYQYFNGALSGAILKNDFTNSRNNIYADLFLKFKVFDFNFGLKAERNVINFSDSSFAKNIQQELFPTLTLSKQLNKTNRVKAEYRRSSYYPSAWNLAPYRVEIDSMTAYIGNPKLNPSIRDAFEITHALRKRIVTISTTLYLHSTANLIASNRSYDSKNFCTITFNNNTKFTRAGIRFSGTIVLLQFIEIEPNIKLFYEEYSREGNTRHNKSYSSDLMISMGLPEGFALGAFGSYNGKLLNAQGYSDPNYSLDAVFIMKQFSKQHLNVYIALRGLAKSNETTYTYDTNNEGVETFKQNTYGLAFRISYFFNVGKKYSMEKVNTFFEKDKK